MAIIQNMATIKADSASRMMPARENSPKGPTMRHQATAAICVTIIATASGMPPAVYLRYSQNSTTPTTMMAIISSANGAGGSG